MNNTEAKEKSFTMEGKDARNDSEMDLHEDNITIVEENKVKIESKEYIFTIYL